MAYVKLWGEIVSSSIWNEDNATRIMWITLLALADSAGFVPGAIPGLARLANITTDEAAKAIAKLCAPDKWSRSQEFDGRRLIEKDGGYIIINYENYRTKRDDQKKREYMRDYMAQRRARQQHKKPLEHPNV